MSKMSFCNRILSVVLCVCMVLTLLPWVSMAVSAADSNGDGGCENGVHNYNRYTLMCSCGAMSPAVVASVTTGDQTYCYTFLHGAIEYAKYCPPEDHAVLTIQQDIDMGEGYEEIKCGVFTIDLNGCEIRTNAQYYPAFAISGQDTNITVMDSGTNGKIISATNGIEVYRSSLTISG